jgi:hypothetical protein
VLPADLRRFCMQTFLNLLLKSIYNTYFMPATKPICSLIFMIIELLNDIDMSFSVGFCGRLFNVKIFSN